MNYLLLIFDKIFNWESAESENFPPKNKQELNIRLNPIILSFPKFLEKKFLKSYYDNSIIQINIALFVGIIMFVLFAIFDYYIAPNLFLQFLIFRTVLSVIIIFIVIYVINKANNKKITQPILSLAVIFISSTIILFIILLSPRLNSIYYIGIILVYFWSYSFLRIRFVWASITGILVFILYELCVLIVINPNSEIFFTSSFILFSSNIAGMAISYLLEFHSRKEFFQKYLLEKSLDRNNELNTQRMISSTKIDIVEERYLLHSKALEVAANSVTIIERSGKIIWCNNAFTKLTGYSIEEVIGKNPRILNSGKHDVTFYRNLWSTILNGHVWSGEIINKNKNGDLYYEEMIITPVKENKTQKVIHFIATKQDISLRKEMEKDLFESERRFRSLFENATMGLYRTTIDGKILMANNALIKMLGFKSLEDLQNRNLNETGYTNIKKRKKFIKKMSEHRNLIGFESEWKKKDGSIIYVRESARIGSDEKNELIYEGTVEDITQSKFAEIELIESRKNLQTVFDNVYDAIFIHDKEGNVINANNKALGLYNTTMEEAKKLNVADLSSKNNNFSKVNKNWQNVIKKNKTYMFEWNAKHPFDDFTFDVKVFLSRISLGNEYYILANVHDITEEKAAQKKLLITQKAVELSAAPILWISKHAEIIYVNNSGVKNLGYTFEELIRMKISDINPNWTDEYWQKIGYRKIKEKGIYQFETIHKRKNGFEYPVEINASIIDYDGEEVIVALVTDISARKRAAKNLLEAKEKAEQSDKLKSEFLAGMSHEIRTPVNTILNFISLIKSDLGEETSDDIKTSFQMIDNGSRRLIRTIDSIINMSQLQAGAFESKIEKIDIAADIINNLGLEFSQVAKGKSLNFTIENFAKETYVNVDSYTITQLFINLIDNAIKYTNEGAIKIIIESDNNYVIIKIADTGIGMSESFLKKIFNPFSQEEMGYTRTFEGNGLGLALVQKYLEINNGIIDVQSKKSVGSTFIVKLKNSNNC